VTKRISTVIPRGWSDFITGVGTCNDDLFACHTFIGGAKFGSRKRNVAGTNARHSDLRVSKLVRNEWPNGPKSTAHYWFLTIFRLLVYE